MPSVLISADSNLFSEGNKMRSGDSWDSVKKRKKTVDWGVRAGCLSQIHYGWGWPLHKRSEMGSFGLGLVDVSLA